MIVMHVVFATGSRADYGIMRRYLNLLNKDPDIELGILATGALVDKTYGRQVELIYEDGFRVEKEIELPLNTSSNRAVLHAMADGLDQYAEYFAKRDINLLIILGDRYEMLSVAIAAAMQQIPILHIHGGEATFANYDEFIRHAITKMSTYHFTSTEIYRNRVIQLGEQPERVFNLGALGAENCLWIDENNVPDLVKNLPDRKYFVILFHPETLLDVDVVGQIDELLNAVSEFENYKCVFLGSNADTHSDQIRSRIQEYVVTHSNATYFENLHTDAYHYLLKHAVCLIGNSSSGIIEAPSLGVFTINIGHRQDGRVKGNSVIDTVCIKQDICIAMEMILEKFESVEPVNPYYQENSAARYYNTTKFILNCLSRGTLGPKTFYDIFTQKVE